MIEAQVKVVNRGRTRAEKCKGRLILQNPKGNYFSDIQCIWSNGREEDTVSTGLFGQVLTIFSFDPVSYNIVQGGDIKILESGIYELALYLDAEGVKSAEIDLGALNFPQDIVSDESGYEAWKKVCKNGSYALFLERQLDGKLIAKTIGKIPDDKLKQLKNHFPQYIFQAI